MTISKQCSQSLLSLRLFFLSTSPCGRINARFNNVVKSPNYSSFASTIQIPPAMRLAHLSLLLPLFTPLTASTLVYSTRTSTITALPTDTVPPSQSWLDQRFFIPILVNTTNKYRSITSAPPLTWNTTLASYATAYAQKCQFKHSGGPYGENLAEGYDNVTLAVGAWGNERKDYKHGEGFSEGTGHWTQLVWNGTTDVG